MATQGGFSSGRADTFGFPTPACEWRGHKATTVTEYHDGGIVGSCDYCEQRVEIVPPAGGGTLFSVRNCLASIAEGKVSDNTVWLGAFRDLADRLQAEREALNEAESLFKLAEAVMYRRFGWSD